MLSNRIKPTTTCLRAATVPRPRRKIMSRVLLLVFFALAFTRTAAENLDCSTVDPNGCHVLAYCVGTVEKPRCECAAGTIDKSGGQGLDCDKNAFSVRYVGNFDLSTILGIEDPSQIDSLPVANVTNALCTSDAEGSYVRYTRIGYPQNPLNGSIPDVVEVRCLYSENPASVNANYDALVVSLGGTLVVEPTIYRWVLPTTAAPLEIPPTGMEVRSVEFKTSCAETGCWVIKGTMTTGEAFNSFDVFNTFFLPQADISAEDPQGVLSYDFDYSDVEWTFSPANHPCTSVAYDAGVSGNQKISTCCIDYPGIGTQGGFVPNYRPTQAFVNWADHLQCDEKYTDKDGNDVCWRVYDGQATWWTTAERRCRVAGGYLAIIDSQEDNDRLQSLLQRREVPEAWIGLRDAPDDANDGYFEDVVFEWVDGTPLSYDRWAPGEPSSVKCDPAQWVNIDGDVWDVSFSCSEFDYVYMKAENGSWYSAQQIKQNKPFVCAFDPPTECISHVVQRPKYSAPDKYVTPEQSPTCLEVHGTDFDLIPWQDASDACKAKGGHLVKLRNLEDHFFLWRLMKEYDLQKVWLGLTDIETEGDWVWEDGDTMTDALEWYAYDEFFIYFRVDWVLQELLGSGYRDIYDVKNDQAGRDCAFFDRDLSAQWFRGECDDLTRVYVCEVPRGHPNVTCDSDAIKAVDAAWDIPFPLQYQRFFGVGKFKGMDVSPGIVDVTVKDPFFGQFDFEIQLDEVELRTKAGKLRGTVGVEHTVDTFLGLANFRPTGIAALDTFATQTAIHLEKTSFFSVSTHGVNEYTFLEYVNMRLVAVYEEDADFSGAEESDDRTVRTDSSLAASYVQVTFTMGQQYQPNKESGGLIPVDSVRAGTGTFFDAVDTAGGMQHVCDDYTSATDTTDVGLSGYTGEKAAFNTLVGQDCGPKASMCASPGSVPDQFVSYNIPLGVDVFANRASNDLSNQIFVDLVVNAVDDGSTGRVGNPNDGADPMQMKTTLTASIPIVDGGINIFCDGVTAKTDLKDVANVDIVVGTANSKEELTRLRILEDIASTDLDSVPSSEINTDSIESALMTLVIKGNESYFTGTGRNTLDFTMELDDVITLHMMEDGEAATSSKEAAVQALIDTPGDDNSDSNGLDTDGYNLNGAVRFTVNRIAGEASLEPTASLLAYCPFNPTRPVNNNNALETCVTRRDVQLRGYDSYRAGGRPTAMEILAHDNPMGSTESAINTMASGLGENSDESTFLTYILGASAYTKELAPNFVRAIHQRYKLNGRFRRAYWINPGYEWTPTQTAGKSIFQVSQRIFLFALVSLDENNSARRRRRMLLQASSSNDAMKDAGAGMGQASMSFAVTPMKMMAGVFEVPEDHVAMFDVEVQLTRAEACMSPTQRQAALRATFVDYISKTASKHHTVQVTKMEVDLGDEQCVGGRRALRKLLKTFSSATATAVVLVVFKEDEAPKLNLEKFSAMDGINSVKADARNPSSLVDNNWNPVNFGDDEDKDESSSVPIALIAGVCGGAIALLVAGVIVMKMARKPAFAPADVVDCVSVEDLKSELAGELSFTGQRSQSTEGLVAQYADLPPHNDPEFKNNDPEFKF